MPLPSHDGQHAHDDLESHAEQVEKVRQAIMRYRELLNFAQAQLAEGEKRYAALFDGVPQALRDTLPEKALQREAALVALADMEPLRRALLRLSFGLRDMHRAFEETYDNVAPEAESEAE